MRCSVVVVLRMSWGTEGKKNVKNNNGKCWQILVIYPCTTQCELYLPLASIISKCTFCIYGSCMILSVNSDHFLKQRWQIILCNGELLVFFEVWTELLNLIYTTSALGRHCLGTFLAVKLCSPPPPQVECSVLSLLSYFLFFFLFLQLQI
jgi:hypothetical protein